ncbi:hypothetical protein CBR_g8103 [Chara braunii]|uniref:Protein kinase domain-containing protein n=1 Tax=Chara braunii TaxID=69332 RepID=A0A388KLG9_CHABU|nr:hypothetical protein CBR_g8103 [Chara braunii]|eukprot:GBG70803.1 hypothetical protein CBR_g8103 [Chara braunii]
MSDLPWVGCLRDLRIDVHPVNPWVLFTPDGKTLHIWNYKNGKLVTVWRMSGMDKAREAKFIFRKDWIVARHVKGFVVYEMKATNLTMCPGIIAEALCKGQAPNLRIITRQDTSVLNRVVVHPTLPYLLSGGARLVLWNWERKWDPTIFRGHSLNVYDVAFSPQDSHIFASTSKDRTIKMWSTQSKSVVQTLRDEDMERAHKIGFCTGLRKLLVSTTNQLEPFARVWDYETGVCIAKLEGSGIILAFFHPHLPYIFTGAKGGEIKVWRESNYVPVSSYYPRTGMTRGSIVAITPGKNNALVLGLRGQFLVVDVTITGKGRDEDGDIHIVRTPGANTSNERMATDESELQSRHDKDIVETEKGHGQTLMVQMERKWQKSLDDLRAEHLNKEKVQAKRLRLLKGRIRSEKAHRNAVAKELSKSRLSNQQLQGSLQKEVTERRIADELRKHLAKRVRELEEEKAMLMGKSKKLRLKIRKLQIVKGAENQDATRLKIRKLQKGAENEDTTCEQWEVQEFSLEQLEAATDNFDEKRKICGDGDQDLCTYQGELQDGTPVVVRKGRTASSQEIDSGKFKTDSEVVDRLKMLRHPHLFNLMGICYQANSLVYKHQANGSVKDWIAGGGNSEIQNSKGVIVLGWSSRFRVMVEVARALCFLHSNPLRSGGPIIHRAIKPANILLDNQLVANIGGVEHALLGPHWEEGVQSSTRSFMILDCDSQYMAPESFRSKVFDEKTDIFAFGITMLEMLTGKFWDALELVQDAIGKDDATFQRVLDGSAGCWDVRLAREVAELALNCASLNRHNRPSMMGSHGAILPILEGIARKAKLEEQAGKA